MTYTFETQKARGDAGELFLDRWFAAEYEVQPAAPQEQRRGIDRVFTHRQTGQRLAVEYKTNYKAAYTGKAFVETVSVDTAGRAGWAYESQADYLVYYIPGEGLIYVITLEVLRRELPRWVQAYPHRAAQNPGCATLVCWYPWMNSRGMRREVSMSDDRQIHKGPTGPAMGCRQPWGLYGCNRQSCFHDPWTGR
jgi:hypothetical protein